MTLPDVRVSQAVGCATRIAGFCKYAAGELLDHSPDARVRRPRAGYEHMPSRRTATSPARCWWLPGQRFRYGL